MKTVLVDINVILDVLLDRRPHVEGSAAVWAAIEKGASRGLVAGHALTTIYYLVQKDLGAPKARRTVSAILRVFGVAPVDARVIRLALEMPSADLEDSVTAAAAQCADCDYIVTRDPRGFRASPIRHLTPEAAAPILLE